MNISRVNDHWIPPLHLEYDKKKMLAMMSIPVSYAYLDGRHYKINIQNLLSSIMRIYGEWYSQFLFGITDKLCKRCDDVNNGMRCRERCDDSVWWSSQNNNAAKKRTWQKTGVTRVLAGYIWWTILSLKHLFVADLIKLQIKGLQANFYFIFILFNDKLYIVSIYWGFG